MTKFHMKPSLMNLKKLILVTYLKHIHAHHMEEMSNINISSVMHPGMNTNGPYFSDSNNNFFVEEEAENKRLLALPTPAKKPYAFLPPQLEKLCNMHHSIVVLGSQKNVTPSAIFEHFLVAHSCGCVCRRRKTPFRT